LYLLCLYIFSFIWYNLLDKCQKVVNFVVYFRHFCYLFLQVIQKKAKIIWTNVQLCFLHLTLSDCAGKWMPRHWVRNKTSKLCKGSLATASQGLGQSELSYKVHIFTSPGLATRRRKRAHSEPTTRSSREHMIVKSLTRHSEAMASQ